MYHLCQTGWGEGEDVTWSVACDCSYDNWVRLLKEEVQFLTEPARSAQTTSYRSPFSVEPIERSLHSSVDSTTDCQTNRRHWSLKMSEDSAPPYTPFFGVMGAASAMVFSGKSCLRKGRKPSDRQKNLRRMVHKICVIFLNAAQFRSW